MRGRQGRARARGLTFPWPSSKSVCTSALNNYCSEGDAKSNGEQFGVIGPWRRLKRAISHGSLSQAHDIRPRNSIMQYVETLLRLGCVSWAQ